ncbi:MAG: hypothetical protein PUF04_09390 [bacterium]|nr:hypothetical protein [bacterium]
MNCHVFSLPELSFTGGSSQSIKVRLTTKSGDIFEAAGCTIFFSLIPYSHQYEQPILTKRATSSRGDDGFFYAEMELTSAETVNFHDVYIYQFTVVSENNQIDPNHQGLLRINRNIDPSLIQ